MDPSALSALSTAALCAATFFFALISGVIPFVLNIELFLLAVAALTNAPAAAIVGLATAGQTLSKLLLYLVGKGALNIKWVKRGAASKAAAAFAKRPGSGLSIVALSAVAGIPPLYGVSLLAGTLRLPVAPFVIIVAFGLLIRFAGIFLAPGLFRGK
jgi:membrane protein YqaA with SNARE-associated domain